MDTTSTILPQKKNKNKAMDKEDNLSSGTYEGRIRRALLNLVSE